MSSRIRTASDAALQIIKKLRAHGHVALLAGGCVRDMLLTRTPKDFDVATDARPARVREIFPRARQVGAKFGVVLVRRFRHDIEVATFRADGPYSDGRHPDEVTFGNDVEDARRRDFTINGLFFDPVDERVTDHVDGRADLESGIIRTIGDPYERFSEDHLRMLRAVRFAARLGFQIEQDTFRAIERLAECLPSISPERVWQELEQILTSPSRATGWSLLVETGLGDHLAAGWRFDERAQAPIRGRLERLSDSVIEAPLALAAVVCDRSPEEIARVCRGLRLSNRRSKAVVWLTRSLRMVTDERSLELADLKLLMAEADWPCLLELLRIDLLARDADIKVYDEVRRRASAIAADDVAPPPLLSGDNLGAMGMPPGPQFGEILSAIYRAQLNEEITNRDQAAAMARELMGSENVSE